MSNRFLITAAFLPSIIGAQATPSDTAFSVPVEVTSQGDTLRAMLYVAAGPGPHHTVVVVKGFPGETSQAFPRFLQSRGFNAISMNLRGQRESDGFYTVSGAPADAAAMIAYLRSEGGRARYRVDPARITLIGTSAGSYAALTAAGDDPTISCVGLVVPFNWTLVALQARSSPLVRGMFDARIAEIRNRPQPPARLSDTFVGTLVDSAESYDLRRAAARLSGRTVLMIGARQDSTAPLPAHFLPVVDALRRAPAAAVRDTILDDAHNLPQSAQHAFDFVARFAGGCYR